MIRLMSTITERFKSEAVQNPGIENPALVSPHRCVLGPPCNNGMMEWWNGGKMEYWEPKTDDRLILCSDPTNFYDLKNL